MTSIDGTGLLQTRQESKGSGAQLPGQLAWLGLLERVLFLNIYRIKKKESVIGGSTRKHGRSNGVDKMILEIRNKPHRTHRGEVYALIFVKEGCVVQELCNEINLLKDLDHPNVIKAYETFICKRRSIQSCSSFVLVATCTRAIRKCVYGGSSKPQMTVISCLLTFFFRSAMCKFERQQSSNKCFPLLIIYAQ